MNIKTITSGNNLITLVSSDEIVIKDASSALDFMMSISYETKSRRIALNKEAIAEPFFDLKTQLAGEILQKFANYRIKFAIIGDFSSYKSNALKDFIFESNKGNNIFFVTDEESAVSKLSAAV